MKIFERIYDNPLNDDGTPKDNILLGEFELLDGDMDDYNYDVIVKDINDGKIYVLHGKEISYRNGGIKHSLKLLEDIYFVQMYRKFFK